MTTATRSVESTATAACLLVAFELGAQRWVVGMTTGTSGRVRRREIAAWDLAAVTTEIARAKAAFGLPADARVYSCYEAGRDGFSLDRWLVQQRVANRVVDSSSIEVPRRKRRAKTDKLDVRGLLRLLVRDVGGERGVWAMVRVPSIEAEDARQVTREIETVQADRTAVRNRIRGLLAAQGVRIALTRHARSALAVARTGAGDPLPPGLRARLERELDALGTIEARLKQLRVLERTSGPTPACTALQQLRGLGLRSAVRLSREVFDWRHFTSGRQLGALMGLTPTPYQSGTVAHEQGISKAGNRRIRALLVELARVWRRWQPTSALTQWYERRFGDGPARLRRIGIVALARKLLIALWRYVATGEVPAGAQVKVTG